MSCTSDIRVWLVEDSDAYRKAVSRTLARSPGLSCDYDFRSAEDLMLTMGKGNVPDVILLDVQLPGDDGISSLPSIRSLAPSSKVIVLTAFDDSEKIYNAICAGASGYLLKSADTDEIVKAINEVLTGGAPMTPSVARKVLHCLSGFPHTRLKKQRYSLTEREKRILRLMTEGLLKKEIADSIGISSHTVNTHIRRIYDKLQVNTNTGAVAKAIRESIV